MMDFLIAMLTVYGISAIVTISKIFEPMRDLAEKYSPNFWKHLTSCMQCLPFWVGIFVAFVLDAPIKVENNSFPNFLNVFLSYLFTGSMYSGTTFLIHTIFVRWKGEKWEKREASERARKIKKGIISE